MYFAHWELFVSPYYSELLLQVCHFFCNYRLAEPLKMSYTSTKSQHAWNTCVIASSITVEQQQGNEQYFKLEQNENGQTKNGYSKLFNP